MEPLEQRALLAIDFAAASAVPGNGGYAAVDTNRDHFVTAIDALLVIAELNRAGSGPIAPTMSSNSPASASSSAAKGLAAASVPDFNPLDVNRDGFLSAIDAMMVVQALDETDVAQIRLEVTDLSNNPITQVTAGGSFKLNAYIFDLRTSGNQGVFAAWSDVTYEAALASTTGPIDHGTFYTNDQSGTSTPGLLDEIGGASNSLSPPGPTERLLWSVPFLAGATAGTINFVADKADISPTHDVLLFPGGPISTDDVFYGSATLEVVAGPTLSINTPASVTEGTGANVPITFTVTLSEVSASIVTVNYTTEGITATDGIDYEHTEGQLTFNPGETSKPIIVNVIGDSLNEATETFRVVLSDATGGVGIGTSIGTGTILDNDSAVTVSIATPSPVTETDANQTLNFVVSLSAASGQTITVNYGTVNGSAVAGSDFTGVPVGLVTFNPGETSKQIPITILGDTIDELTESFQVQLTGSNAANLGTAVATGTILDNDPLPTLAVSSPSVTEPASGTSNLTFRISLSKASGQPITVSYQTANGTAEAGTDYVQIPATQVTFAPGEVFKDVVVVVNDDLEPEQTEDLTLQVTSVGTPALPSASGTGTILDSITGKQARIRLITTDLVGNPITEIQALEPFLIEVHVEDVRDPEDVTGVFAAFLDILYNSSLISATGPIVFGADFPNDHSGSLATPGIIDEIGGSGAETLPSNPFGEKKLFTVQVMGLIGGTAVFTPEPADLSPQSDVLLYNGTGPLTDDDVLLVGASIEILPPPVITIGPASIVEGNVSTQILNFPVTLSRTSTKTITVNFSTTAQSATDGQDYLGIVSGQLTFLPGETSKQIPVTILSDLLDENDETFQVALSGATGGGLIGGTGTAIGTILDDDLPPVASISGPSPITETDGTQTATFLVSLSAPSGLPITIHYQTVNGTAIAGSDFTGIADQTVTFNPGESTPKQIQVTILGDTTDEATETFQVALTSAQGASLGTSTATATIVDNDPLPTLSVTDAAVREATDGPVNLNFTISLSKASSQTITVEYVTVDGTALAGSDYVGVTTPIQVVFNPGETSKVATIVVNSDDIAEDNETFALNISSVGTPALNSATATGTILDESSGKLARIRLVATDLDGNEITQINATDPFLIEARVVDLRDPDDLKGVFAAFLDIVYDSALITATGPITFDAAFPNDHAGSIATPGVIDEIGGAGGEIFPQNPSEEKTLFTVQVVGKTGGLATFTPDPADVSPTHDVLFYGGTGPVNDDDVLLLGTSITIIPPPLISIAPGSVVEGDSGTKTMDFLVTLSKPGEKTITVNYTTVGGTATAGADFVSVVSQQITFAPGETSKTISVDIVGDMLDEDDETFVVNLSGQTNSDIAVGSAIGTIFDNDPLPTVSISDASGIENFNAVFTVTLSAASGRSVTVNFAAVPGSATSPSDYVLTPGQITFAPGETSKQIAVPIIFDTVAEPVENFTVVLSGETNVTLADATGLGTITDIPFSSLSGWVYRDLNGNSIREGGEHGLAKIKVTLTGTDLFGALVSRVVETRDDGSYSFTQLLPGTYSIIESHPIALIDGQESLGTLGGTLLNDQFFAIAVTVGSHGVEYNFGEGNLDPKFLNDGAFYASSLNGRN